METMKKNFKKISPYFLLLLGALRLLYEGFPGRLGFLRFLGGETLGWIFWIAGLAGLLWLVLRQFSFEGPDDPHKEQPGGSALQRFFQNYGIEALILLLTAVSLSMLIRSGYYWDDAVNSTAYLAEKKDAIPTLTHVLEFMRKYLELGRINVLSVYYYFYFYIENVSLYKALIILTILIDQLIFRKVLMEFGVSRPGARLGMLMIPLLLQTRVYQDPVSGFYSLMQILTAEMLLCALFLQRWLESGKRSCFWLSLAAFAVGLLTYEVCFPFLAMICLLIWAQRKNFLRAVRDSLPFVGLTALMLAGVFLVRRLFVHNTYPGVAFSLEPARILRAALTQLAAGLPLSFYSAGYPAAVLGNAYPTNTFMNYDFLSFLKAIRLTDILILFGFIYIIKKISSHTIQNSESSVSHSSSFIHNSSLSSPHSSPSTLNSSFLTLHSSLFILALSFAVLPMVTVAMSERYQGQLMPGLGYLPVYMQYYGIAMLILCLTLSLRPSVGKRALCLSAFSVILLLNLQNNRAVTEIMNRSFYEPRNAGEAALHGGILDFLPEDAVLISVNDRRFLWEADWNNRGLYPQFYGNNARRIPESVGDTRLLADAVEAARTAGISPDKDGILKIKPENVWLIAYNGSSDRGFAKLGHLKSAGIDPDTLELKDAETDQVLYFISGSYPGFESVQYVTDNGAFHQLALPDQLRVRQSPSGILYSLPESERILFNALSPDPASYR